MKSKLTVAQQAVLDSFLEYCRENCVIEFVPATYVFPARDNFDNARRRVLSTLARKGYIQQDGNSNMFAPLNTSAVAG